MHENKFELIVKFMIFREQEALDTKLRLIVQAY